ncbi:7233_t:CDS:2 [Ambispora gerdemannii]|uniref:7233_t:CDS:1 n=1 Tax=Ambispora gerdemannii TaxID=144530 RepID=A0A9N8ZW32_9GLOM|nr:7233_t:CDS:2 [Ambispora gerdemannii]
MSSSTPPPSAMDTTLNSNSTANSNSYPYTETNSTPQPNTEQALDSKLTERLLIELKKKFKENLSLDKKYERQHYFIVALCALVICVGVVIVCLKNSKADVFGVGYDGWKIFESVFSGALSAGGLFGALRTLVFPQKKKEDEEAKFDDHSAIALCVKHNLGSALHTNSENLATINQNRQKAIASQAKWFIVFTRLYYFYGLSKKDLENVFLSEARKKAIEYLLHGIGDAEVCASKKQTIHERLDDLRNKCNVSTKNHTDLRGNFDAKYQNLKGTPIKKLEYELERLKKKFDSSEKMQKDLKFDGLENEFEGLENEFAELVNKLEGLKGNKLYALQKFEKKLGEFEQKLTSFSRDSKQLQKDFTYFESIESKELKDSEESKKTSGVTKQ